MENCCETIYPDLMMERVWQVACSCNNSGGDLDNYYNKQQTDARIKQAKDEVEADIEDLARDVEEIASGVADTYSKEETDTKLALKASLSDVYDKTATDALLATKASTATTDALSGAIDSKQDVSGMSGYATTATVATKADITALTQVNGVLTAHTADTVAHTTASEKNTWNNKLDPSALNGYATEQWVGQQGYLTGYTETDPIFTGSPAYDITTGDTASWTSAATNATQALTQLNGYTITAMSKEDYDLLPSKDVHTIYFLFD